MYKPALIVIGYVAAGGLDLLALRALVGAGYWPAHPLREGMSWHGLSLVLAVATFAAWFPISYRRSAATFGALVVGFCAPLPVLGLVFLAAFRLSLLRRALNQADNRFFLGERQALTMFDLKGPVTGPLKSVLEILHQRGTRVRRRAIIALRGLDPKKSLPLLQKAIQDSDEQVRLLAQTQFNRIQSSLETNIKRLEADLAKGPRTAEKLVRLAEHYHELVYLGLSSEETETIYLGRTIELQTEALRLTPDDHTLRLQLLKSYVKRRSLEPAREYLRELRSAGYQPELLAPWEAEILYLEHDWPALEAVLKQLETRRATAPSIQHVCEFWLTPTANLASPPLPNPNLIPHDP